MATIRYRNHGGDHFVLMPLERQIRGHERAKRAEGMEEHVGEKRMARYNAGRFAVIHRMDGRSVFDGIELALCFYCAFDAIVFIHSDSLDPGHTSQLLAPAMIRRIIPNRRGGYAPCLHFAPTHARQPASWAAQVQARR